MIEAIFVASKRTRQVIPLQQVQAIAGEGLDGDRYFHARGTFSKPKTEADSGRNVTLIAAEAIEAIEDEFGIDLSHGEHRRNLVVRGLDLESLQRATLRIGQSVLRIDRTCPPCKHLSRLLGSDAELILRNRGGLRATILESGEIRVGDAIEIMHQAQLI